MINGKKNATREQTAGTADEQPLPPDWMMFPSLNEAWSRSVDGTIALMEVRIKTFQALCDSAPPTERARVRLILRSYIQVHAVLRELNATSEKTAPVKRKTI
jgi:hypothetical protein